MARNWNQKRRFLSGQGPRQTTKAWPQRRRANALGDAQYARHPENTNPNNVTECDLGPGRHPLWGGSPETSPCPPKPWQHDLRRRHDGDTVRGADHRVLQRKPSDRGLVRTQAVVQPPVSPALGRLDVYGEVLVKLVGLVEEVQHLPWRALNPLHSAALQRGLHQDLRPPTRMPQRLCMQ